MPKLCVLCFRVVHAPPGGRAREVTTLAVGDLVVSAKYSERVGMIGCSRWRGLLWRMPMGVAGANGPVEGWSWL